MLTRLDHPVILVRNLDQTTRDYERLGFAVTPGGEHADGSEVRWRVARIRQEGRLLPFLIEDLTPRFRRGGYRYPGTRGRPGYTSPGGGGSIQVKGFAPPHDNLPEEGAGRNSLA